MQKECKHIPLEEEPNQQPILCQYCPEKQQIACNGEVSK